MANRENKDMELEGIENVVYPGTYSIAGTLGSAIYFVVDICCGKIVTSIAALAVMIAIIIASKKVEQHLKKEYAANREKAYRFKDKVDRYAQLASYCGIIVLVFSFLYNMF